MSEEKKQTQKQNNNNKKTPPNNNNNKKTNPKPNQTKKTPQKTKEREQTTDQKQLMGLGIECWVPCVGLKVNFWCSGHSSEPPNSSCNLRTNERQIGNLP